MNQWDFEPLETLFGNRVEVAHFEPGDIFILRPPGPTPEYILEHMRNTVLEVLPRGTKALFIPADWEIAIGRPIQDNTMIAGLQDIVESLS